MTKIKSICKECNSIVNVELIKIQKKTHIPIKKEVEYNEIMINKLENHARDLFPKITNLFVGENVRRKYGQTVIALNTRKALLEQFKNILKYNCFYTCPICKENILLKIRIKSKHLKRMFH